MLLANWHQSRDTETAGNSSVAPRIWRRSVDTVAAGTRPVGYYGAADAVTVGNCIIVPWMWR